MRTSTIPQGSPSRVSTIQISLMEIQLLLFVKMLPDFEELCNVFIRPQRYRYRVSDLGSKSFEMSGQRIFRQDFQLRNSHHLTLECSIYSTFNDIKDVKKAILYLHCNSGCRLQGQTYLKQAVSNGFALVLFDFAGSGNSEGEYISLGFYESADIATVVNHLKNENPAMMICLWGRSMGAVAALRYTKANDNVNMAVYDSPFSSLRELAVEIGKEKTKFPKFLIQLFIDYIKPIIVEKAKFNIDELDITQHMEKVKVPGLFVGSMNDQLVPFQQVDSLFQKYPCKKELFLIEEEHNQPRTKESIEKIFKSINKYINASEQESIHLQTQTDQTQKARKKLNLTLKSYSQKDLGHFKSQDYTKDIIKKPSRKIVEMRPPKNISSAKYMEISRKLNDKQKQQNKDKEKEKEKEKERKHIPLRKFKSQAIKDQIMKNHSDYILKIKIPQRIVTQTEATQTFLQSQRQHQPNPIRVKGRNTIHHLVLTNNNQDIHYNFKRISFTKANRHQNKQN